MSIDLPTHPACRNSIKLRRTRLVVAGVVLSWVAIPAWVVTGTTPMDTLLWAARLVRAL